MERRRLEYGDCLLIEKKKQATTISLRLTSQTRKAIVEIDK